MTREGPTTPINQAYRSIREEHPDWDDLDKLTEAVCQQIPRRGLMEMVRPLIRSHIRNMMRNEAHRVERLAVSERSSEPAAYGMLTGEAFVLPGGVWVRWLDATAEQHRERAEWLTVQAAGLLETAKRHEDAAARIEKAGVTCLAELDSVAA
jgi:hypothetical protein